ncbi:MAG TPA: hypothetical protein VFO94_14475 [Gammaproteobacteria bacterium]|jgi:hypothetical protein|nr:hypothetical protein [Gammaproteobacteria bacterium]
MLADIHWVRVIVGGVLSEAGVIAALVIGVAIYKKVAVAPAGAAADSRALGERVGYYVAPPAGFVTTALAALWAVRGLDTGVLANALGVGVVSVALTIPFFLGARPEHRLMYGIAFGLRLVAAGLAGWLSLSGALR